VSEWLLSLLYLGASIGFILSLKWLSHPTTARKGVRAGEIGMAAAVIGTLLHAGIVDYRWILIAAFVGSAIGAALAVFMPMTAMPNGSPCLTPSARWRPRSSAPPSSCWPEAASTPSPRECSASRCCWAT
jgi:NAD/NADP transhydrogenase beta subunit